MDFEICNFVDRFMPKHTHYTLTKIQKVKKHNRTPLRDKRDSFFFFMFIKKYVIFMKGLVHLSKIKIEVNNTKYCAVITLLLFFLYIVSTLPDSISECLGQFLAIVLLL